MSLHHTTSQWRNRPGGGAGGRVPPEISGREISADLPGKERQGKKGKWSRKEGNGKREGGKLKMEGGKVIKWSEDFFFFFFFFFCLSLFKSTEICFGSTKMM